MSLTNTRTALFVVLSTFALTGFASSVSSGTCSIGYLSDLAMNQGISVANAQASSCLAAGYKAASEFFQDKYQTGKSSSLTNAQRAQQALEKGWENAQQDGPETAKKGWEATKEAASKALDSAKSLFQ